MLTLPITGGTSVVVNKLMMMLLNTAQSRCGTMNLSFAGCVLRILALMTLLLPTSIQAQSLLLQEQQAIQQAVAYVNSAVVRIETVGGVDLVGEILTGTGPTSGVVLSEDGYLITSSFNFFSKPASVLVTLLEQGKTQRYAAEIVAHDESKMLTLLKIEASGLQPILAASKSEIRVGQRAIALGRTFDLEFSNLSTGIVSALNRVNGKAIQTDAKTSPVNYGGPLIDLTGRCLGIIVPLSPQQQGEAAGVEWYDSGIGFAIPLEDIERVLDRMRSGENLRAGLLGVGFETQGPLAGEAKVLRVSPQSPADQAGIQVNDVITRIDDREIPRLIQLRQILGNRYAGETVRLTLKRNDEILEKELELISELVDYQFPSLGILPERASIRSEVPGIGIRHVFEQSAAAEANLVSGDRVLELAGRKVSSPHEIAKILTTIDVGTALEVVIQRGTEEKSFTVTMEPFPDGDGITNIAPVDIPPGELPDGLKLGRFNQQLPGSQRSFWVYVPESYQANYEHGLLVWVHPAGETQEAEILKFWKDFCEERGLILVGPRAEDLSGWAPSDEEHVKDIVEWMQENYVIDQRRIAVMGLEDSGAFATRLAFKYRDIFRGLICYESPLRMPPPESDPEKRLLTVFVAAPETRERARIEKSVGILQDKKFPSVLIDSEEAGKFSFDLVNSLIQWLDSLDRL